MLAAVLRDFNDLVLEDVPTPKPGLRPLRCTRDRAESQVGR